MMFWIQIQIKVSNLTILILFVELDFTNSHIIDKKDQENQQRL